LWIARAQVVLCSAQKRNPQRFFISRRSSAFLTDLAHAREVVFLDNKEQRGWQKKTTETMSHRAALKVVLSAQAVAMKLAAAVQPAAAQKDTADWPSGAQPASRPARAKAKAAVQRAGALAA
jgi:tRNA(Leu) C34 or U34 (ribose-2'-O)-methylase TrmL